MEVARPFLWFGKTGFSAHFLLWVSFCKQQACNLGILWAGKQKYLRCGPRVHAAVSVWVWVTGEEDSYVFQSIRTFFQKELKSPTWLWSPHVSFSAFAWARRCRTARWKGKRESGRVITFSKLASEENSLLRAKVGEGWRQAAKKPLDVNLVCSLEALLEGLFWNKDLG